eukprot:358209-Chlamydomonas_euryale.AAC.2
MRGAGGGRARRGAMGREMGGRGNSEASGGFAHAPSCRVGLCRRRGVCRIVHTCHTHWGIRGVNAPARRGRSRAGANARTPLARSLQPHRLLAADLTEPRIDRRYLRGRFHPTALGAPRPLPTGSVSNSSL